VTHTCGLLYVRSRYRPFIL